MKQSFIPGVATALVTPFLGKEINYPMSEQLIRQQMDAGIGPLSSPAPPGNPRY